MYTVTFSQLFKFSANVQKYLCHHGFRKRVPTINGAMDYGKKWRIEKKTSF